MFTLIFDRSSSLKKGILIIFQMSALSKTVFLPLLRYHLFFSSSCIFLIVLALHGCAYTYISCFLLFQVICDKFGTVEDMSSVGRVPVLIHIEPEKDPDAAAAIVKVLPQWKGKPSELLFQFPTIDARSINIGIQIAGYKDGDWILSNAR